MSQIITVYQGTETASNLRPKICDMVPSNLKDIFDFI